MLYLSFKFVRKFKFCVSPLVKRYPGGLLVFSQFYFTAMIMFCNVLVSIARLLNSDSLFVLPSFCPLDSQFKKIDTR